jgi:hypothetical protein
MTRRNVLLLLTLMAVVSLGTWSCAGQSSKVPGPESSLPVASREADELLATQSPLPSPGAFVSPLSATQSPLARPMEGSIPVIPFRLDKPLLEGDTQVTGTGPAGIRVLLEDVTFMGQFLAAGLTEDDGRFELVLSKPLEAKHRVGLSYDPSSTTLSSEELADPRFHGDEPLMVPQVGFYYDSALVEEN